MGGPPVSSRGGMVHLILSLCRQFEEAFGKAVDGGKGGGEQILRVFEERLGQNIQSLQFKKVRHDHYVYNRVLPPHAYNVGLLQRCLQHWAALVHLL